MKQRRQTKVKEVSIVKTKKNNKVNKQLKVKKLKMQNRLIESDAQYLLGNLQI